MQHSEEDINNYNSNAYMNVLLSLNPHQRLELIKKVTGSSWQQRMWPMLLQHMLFLQASRLSLSLPSALELPYPYPTPAPGLQLPTVLGANNNLLHTPLGVNVPRPPFFGLPYVDNHHSPRPYNPPIHYHPYSYPSQGTNYNYWNTPTMAMPPTFPGAVGPIRHRRRRQVMLPNVAGNYNVYTYEDDGDDDN